MRSIEIVEVERYARRWSKTRGHRCVPIWVVMGWVVLTLSLVSVAAKGQCTGTEPVSMDGNCTPTIPPGENCLWPLIDCCDIGLEDELVCHFLGRDCFDCAAADSLTATQVLEFMQEHYKQPECCYPELCDIEGELCRVRKICHFTCDQNGDGTVNCADLTAFVSGCETGGACITRDEKMYLLWYFMKNCSCWDGYVFNPEMDDDGMYTVRFRHYRPGLGRWLERDILNVMPNSYQYSISAPLNLIDPNGAIAVPVLSGIGRLTPSMQIAILQILHKVATAELTAKQAAALIAAVAGVTLTASELQKLAEQLPAAAATVNLDKVKELLEGLGDLSNLDLPGALGLWDKWLDVLRGLVGSQLDDIMKILREKGIEAACRAARVAKETACGDTGHGASDDARQPLACTPEMKCPELAKYRARNLACAAARAAEQLFCFHDRGLKKGETFPGHVREILQRLRNWAECDRLYKEKDCCETDG